MRAFIYTGGTVHISYITEHPKGDDLILAADSGIRNALSLGVSPAIVLGDFDSFPVEDIPKRAEKLQVPAEKDMTDTQLAVELALQRGAKDIVIIGGLSGRLDHTLSNLAILEHLHALRVHCVINDGFNRARYLRNGSTLIGRSAYPYLSLLAADHVVKGVDAEGVKYPLKNAKLRRDHQYAVSNEMTGNCAFLSVKKGGIYIIESRDAG